MPEYESNQLFSHSNADNGTCFEHATHVANFVEGVATFDDLTFEASLVAWILFEQGGGLYGVSRAGIRESQTRRTQFILVASVQSTL